MKIIIADDSYAVFDRLEELLASLPQVEIAAHTRDVDETLHCLAAVRPDVIILELHLPGGTGLEILRCAKQANTETAVIVLTNFPFPQLRVMCKNLGADAFLDKSMEFDQVPTVVRAMTERHRLATTHLPI